ncbi:MAG TPA: acetylornithine transaminase [Dermatophilaceae bacterium]|nr:acetylornithine transaminase [Dermatophilaceae bacterium]
MSPATPLPAPGGSPGTRSGDPPATPPLDPLGSRLLDRYGRSLLGVFGRPQRVLTHGSGCYVYDADGRRYLDLMAGLAVSALGHNHPRLVSAICEQASRLVHVSNFYTSVPQIELAERLLALAGAPAGSAVFFGNSGTEAVEAAIKLTRRTGRRRILAAEGSFHGRSTGALALTWKPDYRQPFDPLLPGVTHVPYNDDTAVKEVFAADPDGIAALVLEPIQGEAGVVPADPGYLRSVRELTRAHGALLVVDEIQTGVGRSGSWFAFQQAGIEPDVVTLAKGLAGGVPIGAMLTFGAEVTSLLTAGQHGSTFGGNPLACAAGLAVLETIESEGLLAHVRQVGERLAEAVAGVGHPLLGPVRGSGLLRALALREPVAPAVAAQALEAGFLVNAPNPTTIRVAPPLIITTAQIEDFVTVLPHLLDRVEVTS